jgi:hypothetical protein
MTRWWDVKSGVSYKQYKACVFELVEWTFGSDDRRVTCGGINLKAYTIAVLGNTPARVLLTHAILNINSVEVIVSRLEGDYHRDTRIVVEVTPKFIAVKNHLDTFTISWLLHRGRLFYTTHTLHGIQL